MAGRRSFSPLGFEDIAALAGLRVRDILSDRKYPTQEELCDFGRRVCGASQPAQVLALIAQAMRETLEDAKGDFRIPAALLTKMQAAWETGLAYAGNG